ncbi:integrase catalytic domain-containing protein [Trichonephila inaurata madagascariensis]|uniref:Integrase catalytic domain-containing protein n=1 Tax=Trichonephila inaurata madagascariensis TaxID=2747483 RepID=A0A8X6YP94_9ARAC|nr:integrase catalytic domain-containing protein [Trichonephila inaurata madagascariensis]
MKFLRQEIESEEKVRLARSGFNLELDNINKCTSTSSRRERIPTAAELYNSSENKKESCIFCGKLHFSNHCRYAHNLSYDEKKRILMKRAACFRCFAVKHVFRFCRAKVPPCEFCGKSHYKVMCPEICINENSKNPRQEEKVENENGRDPTLSNATPIRKVLLQTLVVRLRGENKMKYIRVLIDSGSSKSYLTNFAIKEMRYECIAEENLTHSLFGGKETAETHKRYLISLSDFSDKYRCNFEVLNQEIICSGIPRIPRGNFIKEIKKHKIFLSDLNSQVDLLYQFSPDEIHGLIGADVLGKLYTGNIKQLKSDLVLVETRLGWTLMGKTDAGESTDSTNSVMSLHVNDAKISDLWRLDTLGILDPGEKGTRQELEKAAEEHFNRSVKMDSDGRYVVSLPWIQGHPPLPTCRNLAERRLKNCINSLKKTGNLEAYEGVFSEWLQEGVIEEVKNYCNDKSDHYLPHRANVPHNFEKTATLLLESFYVDNCVTSVDDHEELEKFVEESKTILSTAKFELRGWEHSYSDPESYDLLPPEGKSISVLGLRWHLKTDSLTIDLRDCVEDDTPVTKRKILSTVHKIFDPLGFTCPVTLGPKVLLQECWKLKVSWDTELSASISKKFERWRKELSKLNKIEIPRCLIPGRNAPGNLTFHVFCDASKIAYAACVFLRCESENSTTCQLIQARCRVAPMKSLSIPRLELLACSIGARLSQSVSSDMKLENLPKIFWSDSADALYWIKGTETWAPFVYNRVKEIRSLTNTEDWYHVPGPLNAADLPSRGCNVETLAMSRWWEAKKSVYARSMQSCRMRDPSMLIGTLRTFRLIRSLACIFSIFVRPTGVAPQQKGGCVSKLFSKGC